MNLQNAAGTFGGLFCGVFSSDFRLRTRALPFSGVVCGKDDLKSRVMQHIWLLTAIHRSDTK
jgi:hypothetical protein